MIYVYNITSHALGEYRNAFKKLLKNELKDEKTLYTDMISGKKGEKLIRWYYYNMNRFNKLFYSDLSNYQTLFFMQKNDKFHILQSLGKNHKIVLSHCYHEISEKLFLRYCQYFCEEKKRYGHTLRRWYVYKLPASVFNYNHTIDDFYFLKQITNADPFQIDP